MSDEDENADHHYNVGWIDAIDAAVKVVNDAREDGAELREVRERIRSLKDYRIRALEDIERMEANG